MKHGEHMRKVMVGDGKKDYGNYHEIYEKDSKGFKRIEKD